MKLIRIATYALMALLMIAAAAHAGDLIPTSETISANQGLFQWLLGIAILVSLYLFSRQIKASEKNSDMLWENVHAMNKQFTKMHDEFIVIKTEHRMNHKEKTDEEDKT